MQATSRRRADFAKRMCCHDPTVLGDQPEHLSSSAVNNQQNTSRRIVQPLARIITGFGSKKPLASEKGSPASIVRETVTGSRCKFNWEHAGASECSSRASETSVLYACVCLQDFGSWLTQSQARTMYKFLRPCLSTLVLQASAFLTVAKLCDIEAFAHIPGRFGMTQKLLCASHSCLALQVRGCC